MTSVAKIGICALVSMLLAGDALAQTAKTATPATAATPAELQQQGENVVSRGAALIQNVSSMLEAARKVPDVVKAACLDGKLAQINAVQRIAEQRLASLKKAVDSGLRTHEYTVLTVLGQKFNVLGQEANQCNGQSMYETGLTKVEMVIDGIDYSFEYAPSNPPVILPTPLPTVPSKASGKK